MHPLLFSCLPPILMALGVSHVRRLTRLPLLLPPSSSDSQRSIYYFKSPDDVSKSGGVRGTVFLGDTVIEDLDSAGNPRPSFGSAEVEMQRGDKASLLLRVRAKDVRRPIVKDHVALVLRAENVSVKYEWLARMAAASRGGAPVAMPQAQPQQPQAGPRRESAGGWHLKAMTIKCRLGFMQNDGTHMQDGNACVATY